MTSVAGTLARFPVAIAEMCVFTALCSKRGHRYLPEGPVRASSPGFIALVATFLFAAWVRHAVMNGADGLSVLVASAIYLAFLAMLFAPLGAAALLLVMAVSAGVDFIMAGAAWASFVDLRNETTRMGAFAWEVLASIYAVVTYRAARAPAR